jgi:hypothetical protein
MAIPKLFKSGDSALNPYFSPNKDTAPSLYNRYILPPAILAVFPPNARGGAFSFAGFIAPF